MKNLKIGVIGVGKRGRDLLKSVIVTMEDIDIVAVCDEYEDRVEEVANMVSEAKGKKPLALTDYRDVLAMEEIQAVIVSAAWEAHVEIATAAMRAGKYVGLEVGGAYTVEDCWKLVNTYEETGTNCMFLENCCYGKLEMLALNMALSGELGEIVHCNGGYYHDLCYEIVPGNEIRHYRLRNYLNRNCDNYPTHAFVPIAKLLKINNGNKLLSLTSTSSKSAGVNEYVLQKEGAEHPLANAKFAQGDVVTTVIRCAGGETIRLTLGTTTPRHYSRDFCVQGTKGYLEEATQSVFLEKDKEAYEGSEYNWRPNWGNMDGYYEKCGHPLWKWFEALDVEDSHGGMDYLVLRAFFESAMDNAYPPIDVYDAATAMCISALSEQSIANGSMPVSIPDFTNGRWIKREVKNPIERYRLDK